MLTGLEEKVKGLFQLEERPDKLRTALTVFSQFDKLFDNDVLSSSASSFTRVLSTF